MSRLGSGDTADHIIESGVSAAEWSMPTYRANADMITRSSTPPFVRPLLAAIASLSETSKSALRLPGTLQIALKFFTQKMR